MEISQITSLDQISADVWNSLVPVGYPFLRHEFLAALEESNCVTEQSGWSPRHILVNDNDSIVAIVPLYLKTHSWGEFVFDNQWAHAASHYGHRYFPKWLTAIPFTPCQGQRLLVKAGYDSYSLYEFIFDFIKQKSVQENIWSWHCLFPEDSQLDSLKELGLIIRQGVQFHWFNKGYNCFDDFLAELNSSKRKMIKRERRKVGEQGIELIQLAGIELDSLQWRIFFDFYQMTYLKRGMTPYLNLNFFRACAASMGEKMLMVFAKKGREYVGAALSFIGKDTLYGRYWGCLDDYNFLHFEACYYQGLDYCIQHNLQHFDSGAQGEHKIARGFEPIITYSAHWLRDPLFSEAINRFLVREIDSIGQYKKDASSYLPFKK